MTSTAVVSSRPYVGEIVVVWGSGAPFVSAVRLAGALSTYRAFGEVRAGYHQGIVKPGSFALNLSNNTGSPFLFPNAENVPSRGKFWTSHLQK